MAPGQEASASALPPRLKSSIFFPQNSTLTIEEFHSKPRRPPTSHCGHLSSLSWLQGPNPPPTLRPQEA